LDLAEREYLHPIEKAIAAPPGDWADALARAAADSLSGQGCAVWLGGLALRHPACSELLEIAADLPAEVVSGRVSEGGNAAGLGLAGVLPFADIPNDASFSPGMDAGLMQRQAPGGMVLMGAEPEFDCAAGAEDALAEAQFILALNPWASDWMRQHAHVVLPTATYLETPGTFVNGQLDWQSFAAAAPPPGLARPAWKVLRALADRLELEGFGYSSPDQALADLRRQADSRPDAGPASSGGSAVDSQAAEEERFAGLQLPMHSVDGLVRRSLPLQQAAAGRAAA